MGDFYGSIVYKGEKYFLGKSNNPAIAKALSEANLSMIRRKDLISQVKYRRETDYLPEKDITDLEIVLSREEQTHFITCHT